MASANFQMKVEGPDLATAVAKIVVAHETLSEAIAALEKATGINFREKVAADRAALAGQPA